MKELETAGLPTQPRTALSSLRQKTGTGENVRPQKVLGVQQGDKSVPGVRGLGPHTMLPWCDKQGPASGRLEEQRPIVGQWSTLQGPEAREVCLPKQVLSARVTGGAQDQSRENSAGPKPQ